jgi:AraC-like DNA-binding protein
MDWIRDIQKAINYIEENLLEDINTEDVSKYVYSSKDNFQKTFNIVTGFSVSEYIRNRRLTLAGQEFTATNIKVIDAALKYRYETPESFTKAFTRFHGCTPSDSRIQQRDMKNFFPLEIQINIKGGFSMSKQFIAQIPVRQLISNMQGQNYWFNGCMDFLMECLGEDQEYNYWFLSGITGDSFMQMYSKRPQNMVLCYSHNMTDPAIKKAFDACGYRYDYYKGINSKAEREIHDQRIKKYIDKSIPVIARVNDTFHSFAIVCGYDENGLYYILGEEKAPKQHIYDELIFITDKKARPSLADAYKKAVMDIPSLITMPETNDYSFGKKAFIDWAESFQSGRFDNISDEDKIWFTHADPAFTCWNMHGTYLCILGTNGCAEGFLHKALELNPSMAFINELIPLYKNQNGKGFLELIGMEGGFNLSPATIKSKERMNPISNKILEIAACSDNILDIFRTV